MDEDVLPAAVVVTAWPEADRVSRLAKHADTQQQPLRDPWTTLEHPDSTVRRTIPTANPIRRSPSSLRWIRVKPGPSNIMTVGA